MLALTLLQGRSLAQLSRSPHFAPGMNYGHLAAQLALSLLGGIPLRKLDSWCPVVVPGHVPQVDAFYDFWFTFRSWREFPHPDEEDIEQVGSCRM